jgi:hypothetical protein
MSEQGRLSEAAIAEAIGRFRAICLGFPGASEKLSHGESAFFVNGRQFANLDVYHHNRPVFSAWFAAPPGAQESLIASAPGRFFRPPYVGHRGWVALRLDNDPDWDEVAFIASEAVALISGMKRGKS